MNIAILNIAFHRNGTTGEPFYAIIFREAEDKTSLKLGVVFDQPCATAVFEIGKLAVCDIQFGSNSYRGDRYDLVLRDAIQKHLEA